MATTKSKTATPTPEESAVEANEAFRIKLIAAEEKVVTLSDAVDAADLEIDSISNSWDEGDDSRTAEDFSLASVEFKRTTALHAAAQRSVLAIQRSIVSTDTTLAEIVKPWIEAALPGVPVTTTFIRPTGKPSLLPVAYVVQTERSESNAHNGGGVVTGPCSVHYFRSPLHKEIDTKTVEHAASLAGCQISAGGVSHSEDGYVHDTTTVRVEYGHLPIPLIKDAPTEAMAIRLAQGVASTLAGSTNATTDPALQMLQGGVYQSAGATVRPGSGKIVKSVTDAQGTRVTDVRVSLTYDPNGRSRRTTAGVDTKLRSVMETYVETFTQALGQCKAAEIVSIDRPDGTSLINAAVLLSFVSRIR